MFNLITNNIIIIISRSIIAHSLSLLAYGKAVTLGGSLARLDLGAITKTKKELKKAGPPTVI